MYSMKPEKMNTNVDALGRIHVTTRARAKADNELNETPENS